MIEPDHLQLSIARQCELVAISRSGFYYRPAGETPLNLALRLYGKGDPFYSIEHSRANFEIFRQAGGDGQFLVFDVPGNYGHAVASHRELWLKPVSTYLTSDK